MGQVFVAGAGVISAIGNSLAENMDSFRSHRSGIGPIRHLETKHRSFLPVGEVPLSQAELNRNVGILTPSLSRTSLLGIHAAREALQHANLSAPGKWRTALISGTTVGGMDKTEIFAEQFFVNRSSGRLRDVVNHECGRATERIAEALGISHFVSTINTACSSSVNAIIYGYRLIQAGLLDVVVAGGTDALTRFTLNGFNSLMILDREPCRPFDANRNGLNLGEGAGYLVLVSEDVSRQRKKEPLCRISGFGNTNDAYHQTASSPEGRGSYEAMKQAIDRSGILPGQIDYINLHGTGTVNNDQSEGTAIKRIFGEQLPAVSSTKSFTGHTLGACGGIEAAYAVMCLVHQCVLPNLRFETEIPETGIRPETKFRDGVPIHHVMSNSFGFGGNCSSIIFSAA